MGTGHQLITRPLTPALDPGDQDSSPRSATICVIFEVFFISLSLGCHTCVIVLTLPPSGSYDLLSGERKRQTGGHHGGKGFLAPDTSLLFQTPTCRQKIHSLSNQVTEHKGRRTGLRNCTHSWFRGHSIKSSGPTVTKESLLMACEVKKSKWCGPNRLQASLPAVTLQTLLESL